MEPPQPPESAPVPAASGTPVKAIGLPVFRRRGIAAIVAAAAILLLAGLGYAHFADIKDLLHKTPPTIAAGVPQLVDPAVPAKGIQFTVSVAHARAGYQVQVHTTKTAVAATSAQVNIIDKDPELLNQLSGPPGASGREDLQIALLDQKGRTAATDTLRLPPALFDAVSKALAAQKTPPRTPRPIIQAHESTATPVVEADTAPQAAEAEKQDVTKSESGRSKPAAAAAGLRSFGKEAAEARESYRGGSGRGQDD